MNENTSQLIVLIRTNVGSVGSPDILLVLAQILGAQWHGWIPSHQQTSLPWVLLLFLGFPVWPLGQLSLSLPRGGAIYCRSLCGGLCGG